MKYFIQKGGIKGPFTIEELREFNITPTTLVSPEGQSNITDEQHWAKAGKFEELAQLFTESEPNIPLSIISSKIEKENDDIKSTQGVSIEGEPIITTPPIEPGGEGPIFNIWLYTIIALLMILSVAYWLTKKPSPSPSPIIGTVSDTLINIFPKVTDCKVKSDSILKIGEQNIEQANGESLTAFRLMKDYKDCADKETIKQLKVKFNSQITTDEAIINDPDIQKRNSQFNEAIKLLDEIITPNQ